MADHIRLRGLGPIAPGATSMHLFDGEDVDVGEAAPDTDELTADELAVITASMADPDAPPNGIMAN
jgi:hypothetical protein